MEIKKGYKQTEIGIIPEDWEVKNTKEIFTFLSTATYSRAQLGDNGDIQCLHYGDIHTKYNNFVDFNKIELPRILNQKNTKYALLQDGDIVMADASEDYVGLCKSIEIKNIKETKAISGLHTILLREKGKEFACGFKGFLFDISFVRNQLVDLATGMKVFGVSKKNLESVFLPIPPLSEQTAIAIALSDTDALITALDKLIAKKKLIKQGTMQQLLTGKKRLPGFSGEWVEKRMGEILNYEQPTNYIVKNTEYVENGIPVLTAGKTFILGYTNEIENIFSELPVIIFDDFTTATKFVDFSFKVKSSAMKILLKDRNCNLRFIFEIIQMIDFPLLDHQRYWISEYSNILVMIPFLKEQNQIATILSDMDAEIAALEAKRDKYKQVKTGMMQKLLTGQIRLVNTLSQRLSENRIISVYAHIIGGHIVNKLCGSKGWGRTKLQKSIHLVDYYCQLDLGGEYIRNITGPDNQLLMNHIDSKFRQYQHVRIEVKNDDRGRKYYNYIPTNSITEVEQAFECYSSEKQKTINNLLHKIKKMDLARAEIVSTLYAVWNNRIIKRQPINDDLLLEDFYDWSAHKSDFCPDLVLRGLNYMRQEDIIPIGWGKYIDKKRI
jgi:type I restriction enzyme S subunit